MSTNRHCTNTARISVLPALHYMLKN